MSRGPWLTAAFKAEVWRHWQAGETCSEIGRALYKTCGVIHGVVAERGGVAPVARCRSRRALTLLEREEISRGLCALGLQAPNRAHDLRSCFGPDGVRVHDRTDAGSPVLLGLRLTGVGRGEPLAPVQPGLVSRQGARVEIRRPDLTEWYLNSEAGLEQGFTLTERPAGQGELVLELALDQARAALTGDRVILATGAGRKLAYGGLVALDARGAVVLAASSCHHPSVCGS